MNTMKLLEQYTDLKSYRLENTVILHINHCMDNSFYYTSQLEKCCSSIIFIAVPYNERGVPLGLPYVSYHGKPVEDGYILYKNGKETGHCSGNLVDAVRDLIYQALEHEIKMNIEEGKKLLIIEDGGYHYEVVSRWIDENPEFSEAIYGAVEQTTAGMKTAESRGSLKYPVLSVARSAYKVRIEAYFVAERIAGEIQRYMRQMNSFTDFRKILIIGYGVIGRSVAKCMEAHHTEIYVHDINPNILKTASDDGFKIWDGTYYNDMIIIGNAGAPSFTNEMLKSFLSSDSKSIFIVSSSSKQVEFQHIIPVLKECKSLKCNLSEKYFLENDKEIILMAEGYPINFYDKTEDSLCYSMIDPVFTEMFLCGVLLYQKKEDLKNKVYLFGRCDETGGSEKEYEIIEKWLELYSLETNFRTFNRHPQEESLCTGI